MTSSAIETSAQVRWHTHAERADLVREVAGRIQEIARQAIDRQQLFRIVLAGGSTPQAVYRTLAASAADWSHWQVYFGDERCLPADHPERNSVMAQDNWLAHVAIPAEQVHVIPAEHGPAAAARDYAARVDAARPFDLVLLGMGEDGHTASLFPGHACGNAASACAVYDAPKPPAERVSLSATALSDADHVMVLVTGAGKQAAVRQWRQGADLPVARIHGRNGVDVHLDAAAAGVTGQV